MKKALNAAKAALLATTLMVGVPAAYAIARLRFPGRDVLLAFLTAPLLLPTIVLGLAMLLVFYPLRLAATRPRHGSSSVSCRASSSRTPSTCPTC